MTELTLVLEASTPTGSLALVAGESVVAESNVAMRARDGEQLLPAVVALLRSANRATTDLGRIVCSSGPGGFTGLRIAAAIGKGLAESLGVPLWGVSSLALLAAQAAGEAGARAPAGLDRAGRAAGSGDVVAIIDAMRDEWYVQHFAPSPDDARRISAQSEVVRLTRDGIVALAARTGATVVGDGAATFGGGADVTPRARHIVALDAGALLHPVDIASWEPDYGRLAEAQVKWEATHGRALGRAG